MKKFGIILGMTGIITTGCYSSAVTIGQKPPVEYINNLANCKVSTIKNTNNGYISEYKINGEQPDGRCKVTITGYMDYSNPQTYKDAISIMKMFAEGASKEKIPESAIPTQAEMIKESQNDKDITVCKFTPQQVVQIYSAYQKNDDKQDKGMVKRDKDGNITEFSGSFNSSKMSSYDRLMMNYGIGTCEEINRD